MKPPLPTATRNRARALRQRQTLAEAALWRCLRSNQLGGLKFRRQHPIPPYIVDFYCDAHKLVVEIDGSQHSVQGDARRTAYLERKGLVVMRFHANEALQYTDAVAEAIWNRVGRRTLTPTPLPEGEGLNDESQRHDD